MMFHTLNILCSLNEASQHLSHKVNPPPPLKAHACNINSSLHFMQNWAYVKLHLHLPLLPNNNIFKHHFYLRQWAIDITVKITQAQIGHFHFSGFE